MNLSKEALYNICSRSMQYKNRPGDYDLIKSILKRLDISINFDNQYIEYLEDVDTKTIITYQEACEKFPYKWKVTFVDLSECLQEIEDFLNTDVASGLLYPIFQGIGYVLYLDEGRWRLVRSGNK